MKKKYKWTKFDEVVYLILNYIFAFGWIIVIWSPKYNLKLFFTWIGIFILAFIMLQIKEENKK